MNHFYLQTAFLGDLLLSVPTLRQLRYLDPKSKITLVCRKGYGVLATQLGICDEVIEVDKRSKKKLISELKGREFDTLICPHQSLTSHRLARGIQAKKKIGYKNFWNALVFDVRVLRELRYPEAIRQLQLLAPLSDSIGIKLDAFSLKSKTIPAWAQMNLPHLHWSTESIQEMVSQKVRGLKVGQKFLCIAPGSVWETKRWPTEKFIRVATALARLDYQIVILGAPDERELCERVQLQVPNSYNLAGHLSVVQSLMILSKAKGIICNDSGAMHMASLLNLPAISLFGPTVQELGYKPWNPRAVVIENDQLLCRPCGQHGARKCPIGTHQCMTSLSEQRVVDKAIDLFV